MSKKIAISMRILLTGLGVLFCMSVFCVLPVHAATYDDPPILPVAGGRCKSFVRYDSDGSVMDSTAYTYDKQNRLIKYDITIGSAHSVYSYSYNPNGTRKQRTYVMSNQPGAMVTTYTNDAAGHAVLANTVENGSTYRITLNTAYNAAGLRAAAIETSGKPGYTDTVNYAWQYDATGHCTTEVRVATNEMDSGITFYTYDAGGNLLSISNYSLTGALNSQIIFNYSKYASAKTVSYMQTSDDGTSSGVYQY
ncbi:MAG: hypothetical protein LKJ76_00055 [Lachnospiraceae bacterium]|jgi:hypothetical protein|nr:hypothetical protein [Lachnospiraceae bacterium]